MAKLEANKDRMDEVIKDIYVSMKRLIETCDLLAEGFWSLHTNPENLSSVLERMARLSKPKPS